VLKKENKKRYFPVKILFSIALLAIVLSPFTTRAVYYGYNNEPNIATENATNVDSNSATLNGFVDGNGFSTRAWFEYGRDINLTSSTSKSSYGSGVDNFSKNISGLRENIVYYFRAVAQNSEGTVYGSIFSFRTGSNYNYNQNVNYYNPVNCYNSQNYYNNYQYPNYNNNCDSGIYNQYSGYNNYSAGSAAPTALTSAATAIGSSSAQMNATILNNTNNPSNVWFEWGTTASLGNSTLPIPVGFAPSISHTEILTGLAPNTVYYFRAVAENSFWRNNGSVLSFTTNGNTVVQNYNPPVVYTPYQYQPTIPPNIVNTGPMNGGATTPATSTYPIGANVVGSISAFFPSNIIGWMILLILVLILVMLIKHPQVRA
jgi:hypothetical protein